MGLVSLPHFAHDFSRRIFILYSINWPNMTAFTSWDIWQHVYCNCLFPSLYVIHVEIYLSFVIKQFSYMTKKSGQKFKYLKNEKWFHVEIKTISHQFFRAFSCRKLSQNWECAFTEQNNNNNNSNKKRIVTFSKRPQIYNNRHKTWSSES